MNIKLKDQHISLLYQKKKPPFQEAFLYLYKGLSSCHVVQRTHRHPQRPKPGYENDKQ